MKKSHPLLQKPLIKYMIAEKIITREQLASLNSANPEETETIIAILMQCLELGSNLAPPGGIDFGCNLFKIYIKLPNQPNKWAEVEKQIKEINEWHIQSHIRDAANDYLNCIVLPEVALQAMKQAGNNAKDRDCINLLSAQTYLYNPFLTEFFKDVLIHRIKEFSDIWHEQGTRAILEKHKDYKGAAWEPLTATVTAPNGITISPLTNADMLREEGQRLKHCISTYTAKCNHQHSHNVSLRNDAGKSLSTGEFTLTQGQPTEGNAEHVRIAEENNYYLKREQHQGYDNSTPPPEATEALQWYQSQITAGKIKVDANHLEQKRQERVALANTVTAQGLNLFGFDVNNPEIREKITEAYRGRLKGILRKRLEGNTLLTTLQGDIDSFLAQEFCLKAAGHDRLAILEQYTKQIAEKMEKGWRPCSGSDSLLHIAAEYGAIDAVTAILKIAPETAKIQSRSGGTPLHYAAQHGKLDIVKAILEKAPESAKISNNYAVTPLHYAARNGHLDVVKAILEKAPEIAVIQHDDGDTALCEALINGHLDVVKAILEKAPESAKIQDYNENTALHYAAKHGKLDIVKAILEKVPTIVEIKNEDGKTALDLAESPEIKTLLEEAMAKNAIAAAKPDAGTHWGNKIAEQKHQQSKRELP